MNTPAPTEKPWLAEKSLSPTQASQVIIGQFPELAPLQIDVLGKGWDNLVFRVNQDLMFRFPRRAMALDFLEHEWSALAFLEHKLPLQTPRPRFRGLASQDFDWPFMGYELVPGTTACRARLTALERHNLAPTLAHALKCLHGFSLTALEELALPHDILRRMDLSHRKPKLAELLKTLQEQKLLPPKQIAAITAFVAQLPEQTPPQRPCGLCHGDLYARHLIVDTTKQLTGLIDWGDVHLGDPAVDLAIVYSFLPPETQPIFWQVYGAVSEQTQLMAQFRALYHSLMLLNYSADIHDQALSYEAKQALEWLIGLY